MLATSPVAWAIAAAPTDAPERTLLLYCPEQGGWQASVFFEGRWLDFATLTTKLEPPHFTDVLPEPEEERSPVQHVLVLRQIEAEQNVARFYAHRAFALRACLNEE